MAVMALVCLWCAWHLWQQPTTRLWETVAVMDLAMLTLHATMMTGPAVSSIFGRQAIDAGMDMGSTGTPMTHALPLPWMVVGLTLILGQLTFAASALSRQRRTDPFHP